MEYVIAPTFKQAMFWMTELGVPPTKWCFIASPLGALGLDLSGQIVWVVGESAKHTIPTQNAAADRGGVIQRLGGED